MPYPMGCKGSFTKDQQSGHCRKEILSLQKGDLLSCFLIPQALDVRYVGIAGLHPLLGYD